MRNRAGFAKILTMYSRKTNNPSERIKNRARQIANNKKSLEAKDYPWLQVLAGEQLSGRDDQRFARYINDLVHGLEAVKRFPQGVTIFGSARFHQDHKYYRAAYELGSKLAMNGHTVTTGGGPGIMEAANRGAFEQGGNSIGFNIKLATEQDLNPWVTDSFEFHYFFARKLMMTLGSKMFIYFPGGFGTMDEFTEVLELMHTGKMPRSPIVLYGREFWAGLDDWFAGRMSDWRLIETGVNDEATELPTVKPADYGLVRRARDLYLITDNIDEIVAIANRAIGRDVDQVLSKVTACQIFGECD